MSSAYDSKFRNRAMLEGWAHDVGGRVDYRRDEEGWTVTVVALADPETITVTSGPQDTIEAGCVVVMEGLGEAGQTIKGFTPLAADA
jgi:hypothetical protein